MQPLTERQQQVLSFITSYLASKGYPPSQREIARHLGVSSNLGVMKHLDALEKKGYLRRDSHSRAISVHGLVASSVSLPIVGTVRAGQLTLAVEEVLGHFTLGRDQLQGGSFFLKVRGDSMIEAAICDGDLALVRPQQTAEDRDIVVAMVEGEATVKEFYLEPGRIRLQPRNRAFEPIIVHEGEGEVTIIGKVVGIFRSLA